MLHVNDISPNSLEPLEMSANSYLGECSVGIGAEHAILLKNVSKSYKSLRTAFRSLKNLSLFVPKGSIYGLLGPSGCGKTTLLRCVLGRLSIDEGTILVFGHPPYACRMDKSKPKIGYMPQDVALLDKLTVIETLHFFGAIAGLSKKITESRCEFLIELLCIPFTKQKINELSGGQKRRVSFAVALLHEPELLILDEPTVGVDPVLRKSIWDYLNTLVTTLNTTIIITTHYIEEARMAQNVGLMLNGEILVQAPPENLIQEYKCTTLENVFLKLCIAQKDHQDSFDQQNNDTELKNTFNKTIKTLPPYCTSKTPHENNPKENRWLKNFSYGFFEPPRWHRIKALATKSLLACKGFPLFLGFQIVLPTILTFVFGGVVGKPLYGLTVGVVNDDSHNLGTLFLDKIDTQVLQMEMYSTFEAACNDVDRGLIWNAMYINPNFTNAVQERLMAAAVSSDMTIEQSLITLKIDHTNQFTSLAINKQLSNAFKKFSEDVLVKMGMNPLSGSLPLKYEARQVYGDLNVSYDQFIIPPFFLSITFFMAMGMTALLFLMERQAGSYERMLITGVGSLELIIGYLFAQVLILSLQVFIMMTSAFLILGYSCEGSYVLVVLLPLLQGLCGMCFGIFISAVVSTEIIALLLIIGIYFITILTEGMVWPIQGMSEVFQFITYCGPQTFAGEAMRSIMNRGWGIGHPAVFMGFVVTLIWAVIMVFASCVVAKLRQ